MSIDVGPSPDRLAALRTTETTPKFPVVEKKRSPTAEAAIIRLDRILPREKMTYPKNSQNLVSEIRTNSFESDLNVYGLSILVDIVLSNAERKASRDDVRGSRLLGDFSDRVEIVLNPTELTVVLKSLFLLSRTVKDQPALVEDMLTRSSTVRTIGEAASAVQVLAVIDKLHLLDHPQYRPLAESLRRHILVLYRFTDYAKLQRRYKGPLFENQQFWQEGFAQVHDLQFPNNEALVYNRRVIKGDQRKVRNITIGRSLLEIKNPFGRSDDVIVEEYQNRYQKGRKIQASINRMAAQETKDWRASLEPFTDRLGYNPSDNNLDFLLESVLEISRQFTAKDRDNPDRDLSRKAKKIYGELDRFESRKKRTRASSDDESPEYTESLKEYLREGLLNREPLIIWLMSFRNETSSFLLSRAIAQDPDRFVDLEKLILHELSKFGLLKQKGEQDLLMRSSTSSDDRQLREGLRAFLQNMQYLSGHYTKINFGNGTDFSQASMEYKAAVKELVKPDDNPIAELFSQDYLMGVTREAALDRFDRFVTNQHLNFDRAMLDLRLKSREYRQLLADSWWNSFSLKGMWNTLQMTYDHRESKANKGEALKVHKQVISDIWYSTDPIKNYDDMPFIPYDYDDDLVRNFLINGDGVRVDKLDEVKRTTEYDDSILREARSKIVDGLIYVVQERNGRIPIYSGYQFTEAWKLKGDEDVWMVAVSKLTRSQHTQGIVDSSLSPLAYEPYTLMEINFEKTTKYLETLQSNPEIADIYREFILELKATNTAGAGELRRVALKHIMSLQRHIQLHRYYDDKMEKPESEQDALQYFAQHPDEGFKCLAAARIAKNFLESVGIRASVLSGEEPYFYEGRAVASQGTGHAKCIAIFPSGPPIEIDLTPPITSKTPDEVRFKFIKTSLPGEKVRTLFGKEQGKLTKKTIFRSARYALVGVVLLAGIKVAVFPDTGSANGLFNLGRDRAQTTTLDESENDREPMFDFSQVDWQAVRNGVLAGAAGLGAAVGGTASFLYSYEKIDKRRRRKKWESRPRSRLEEMYKPSEQVLLATAFHKMREEVPSQQETDSELRRLNKLLKNFDWESATPLLELVAFELAEGISEEQELLEDAIANRDYKAAYDVLALDVFQTMKEDSRLTKLKSVFIKRKPNLLGDLRVRGKQVAVAKEYGFEEEIEGIDENSPQFKTFCKSMDMIQLIQEFRETLSFQIEMYDIHSELAKGDRTGGTASAEVAQASAMNAWRMKSKITDTIEQIERSLAKGAVKIFTADELAKLNLHMDPPREVN